MEEGHLELEVAPEDAPKNTENPAPEEPPTDESGQPEPTSAEGGPATEEGATSTEEMPSHAEPMPEAEPEPEPFGSRLLFLAVMCSKEKGKY